MKRLLPGTSDVNGKTVLLILVLCIFVPLLVSVLIVKVHMLMPVLLLVLFVAALFVIKLFRTPAIGISAVVAIGFFFVLLGREIPVFNYGVLVEVVLVLTCLAALIYCTPEERRASLNDLTWLMIVWFLISLVEVVNPATNVLGALREFRFVALYPLMVVWLSFLLLRRDVSYINSFLILIIGCSLVGVLNGIKQNYIGLSPGEQAFIDEGAYQTHVLWGKLRVFSFYNDAGQFGASQAHIGLIAFILALGPYVWWKRLLLLVAACLFFFGMLISGTRGSLFALVAGAGFAIFLTKNFKAMAVGGGVLAFFVAFLKFTSIGSSNYHIYRLRTALDPGDASLNVRFDSQEMLRQYLSGKPFGDGLGSIGYFGMKFNGHTYLSTIQPDSYWVKVWAMYGIVGLTIWVCMMMYILGKCCGIVWNIRNPALKNKLLALTAGAAGIFFCSYGNEVINNAPSSFIVYVSWVLVFLGPMFDRELNRKPFLHTHSNQNAI